MILIGKGEIDKLSRDVKALEGHIARANHSQSATLNAISLQLSEITEALLMIVRLERQMNAELDALAAQVEANTQAEAAAVQLISGLAAQMTELNSKLAAALSANDAQAAGLVKDEIVAMTERLSASAAALGAAVVANTPSAPAPAAPASEPAPATPADAPAPTPEG